MFLGKLKPNWEREMTARYFFNAHDPTEEEKSLLMNYLKRHSHGFTKVFYAENKEDFCIKLARRVKSLAYALKQREEDVLFTIQDTFFNKHGHHQLDIHDKTSGMQLYTAIFDETNRESKTNCFLISWTEADFPSFGSGHLYNFFFIQNQFEYSRGTNILAYLGEEVDFKLAEQEEKVQVMFHFSEQAYQMTIGHIGTGELFDPWSWHDQGALIEHILHDEPCKVCGQTKEESSRCPFFEIDNRKRGLLGYIQQKTDTSRALFRYIVDQLIQKNKGKSTSKVMNQTKVRLSYFENNEPYIHLRIYVNGFAYNLSRIKWKPGRFDARRDMRNISNWDYENATLTHVSSFEYYQELMRYPLNECCSFCEKPFNYRSTFQQQETSVCIPLNKQVEWKRNILDIFLQQAELYISSDIPLYWSELVKEEQPKNKVKTRTTRVHIRKKHRNAYYDRKEMERLLPHFGTEHKEKWAEILGSFGNACALTGKLVAYTTTKKGMEHFIPLSIGHGGTNECNVYPMDPFLNYSKNNKNPFIWIRELEHSSVINHEDYPVLYGNFLDVVDYLASKNNLTLEEFENYVNWCFEHPRSHEEVAMQPHVSSVRLWQEVCYQTETM